MDTSPITVLEFREKSSENKYKNGDWETRLQDQVIINPGDAIAVRQAFIDTKSESSNVIKIEEDTIINLQNIVYNTNWETSDKTFYAPAGRPSGNDGYDYILCNYEQHGTIGSEYQIVSYLDIKSTSKVEKNPPRFFTVKAAYKDISDNVVNWVSQTIETPTLKNKTLRIAVSVVSKINPPFVVLNESELQDVGMTFVKLETEALTDDVFHPIHFSSNIIIPAGTYEPDEIAKTITEKLTVNTTSRYFTRKDMANSSFLIDSESFPNACPWDASKSACLIRSDGTYGMSFDPAKFKWIGSNQVALEYDEPTQKFLWSFLHMPVYDNSGDIVVGIKGNQAFPDNTKFFEYGRAGGIAFTSLSPKSFWEDTLGFDIGNVCIRVTQQVELIDGIQGHVPVIDLEQGKYTTAGLTGLDSVVIKNNTFTDVPTPPFQTTSSQTYEVRASRAFGIQGIDNGYFLIDIQAKMFNEIFGQNLKSHSIQAIVGRYYSADSYTSSQPTDSIPFQHRGTTSFVLDSARISILNPDGTLAPNLGDDSTIFIEVRKQQPALMPTDPKNK